MNLKKQNPWLVGAAAAVFSLCSYVGFFFRDNLSTSLQSTLILSLLFGLFFFSFRADWFYRKLRLCWLLALFLGGMYALGKCLFAGAPLTGRQLLRTLALSTLGFSALYYLAVKLLFHLVASAPFSFRRRSVLAFFDRHPLSGVFCLMFLLWLPHLILKYPSGMNWDSLDSMSVGLGIAEDVYNQPVIYTLILTAFLKLGVAMGNPNLGIFIPSALAMPLLALAVADCYKLETELGAADWAKLLTLLFFGFSPFVVGYVGVCIKDVPYMIALLFWLTALIRCCLLHDRFWCSWRQPAQLLLSAVFVVAFRSNGQYVLIPTLLLLLVLELKRRRALSGQRLSGRVACLLLACLLPSLTVSAVTAVTGSRKPSPREALALPFQQTARLAAEHPEQIRPEEAEIIDRLLDFDSLAEDYNPDTVDPVKLKYNESATGADLAAYLKVWFRQFFRAPSCYVKATLAQNYYLFYPEYSNYYYYYSCVHHDFVGPDSSIHIGSPALVSDVWGYYYQPLLRQAHELPLLYLVNNMTTYIFLFLALLCFTCTKKDWALLPVLLPVFLSLAIIVVAPCIKNHVRYAFPVIYSVPLLFAVYSSRIKTE